jgi:hypothetical protein
MLDTLAGVQDLAFARLTTPEGPYRWLCVLFV